MVRRYCYNDVVPFTAMVAVECTNVGLNTLFKAASSKGMSKYVFVFYAYAIATLVLFPIAFISHKKTVHVPSLFNFSLFSRIFLLAVTGFSAQMMCCKGIEYSSPTLASAFSNLTLAFTFMLAIIFRMEKIKLGSWSTRTKIAGTVASISGALVVVLYKGPTVLLTAFLKPSSSSQTNWIIGGLLLAVSYLLFSICYILQTQVMKMYPSEIVVVFLYNLFATIVSAPVCSLAERNLTAWRLTSDMALVACVYAGFFGPCFGTVVHSWGLLLKGPVYLASFRPLSIAIAAVMGVMFLGDALHLGSILGVVIISVGFYVVLWAKATEDDQEMGDEDSNRLSSNCKTPLLQSHKDDQI